MPKSRRITGVILAGGAGRRMGRDKAHLPWDQATLLEHLIKTLRPVTDELLVVVKRAGGFGGLGARVVEDFVHAHALGGLYTGLTLATYEQCFVCACDQPFLNPALARFLCEQLPGFDLVIPETERGLEPLQAAYARSALPVVQRQLRQGRWDLRALVPKLRARIIRPDQWRGFDREALSFVNLNSPADYEWALGLHAIR